MEGDADVPVEKAAAGDSGKRDVTVNLEYISDRQAKALLRVGWACTVLASALLIVEAVVKFGNHQNYLLQRNSMQIVNVAVAAVCLAALLPTAAALFWNCFTAGRRGKQWTVCRRRIVILASAEVILQIINLVFLLVPNAIELASPCSWFTTPVHWSGFMQWTCWFSLGLVWLIQVHRIFPLNDSPGFWNWLLSMRWSKAARELGTGGMVIDLPLWLHAPKVLFFWLPGMVCLLIFTLNLTGTIGSYSPVKFSNEDYTSEELRGFSSGALEFYPNCRFIKDAPETEDGTALGDACKLDSGDTALSITMSALLILQLVLYIVLAWVVRRKLRDLPYGYYRVSNIELRVQLRTKLVMTIFSIVCASVLWLPKRDDCNTMVLTWMGLTPMQIVATAMVMINGIIYCPVTHSQEQIDLHHWLQDMAWTEDEIPTKLENRHVDDRALFCFETAAKTLYWSWLVYKGEEKDYEMAKQSFGLTEHQLFAEPFRDSKCCMAWGGSTVVISFRGTASLANAKIDAKAWRVTHPPARGSLLLRTKPLCHMGFLEIWQAGDLNKQVLGKLREVLTSGGKQGWAKKWRVVCTGHSLGGAMAMLCAMDVVELAKEIKGCLAEVECVTFGAPRPGNTAFARDYREKLPNSWDVFHNNDPVSTQGKGVLLYKRAAHRVVLTPTHDLIVRPSHLESSMQHGSAPNIKAHKLRSYAATLCAVLRAQRRKGTLGEEQAQALRAVETDILEVIANQLASSASVGLEPTNSPSASGKSIDKSEGEECTSRTLACGPDMC